MPVLLWLWICKYTAYSLKPVNVHSAVSCSKETGKVISWDDFYLIEVYLHHDAFQATAMFIITVLSSRKTFLLFQKPELVRAALCIPHLISCSSMGCGTALSPKNAPCTSVLEVNCTGSKRGAGGIQPFKTGISLSSETGIKSSHSLTVTRIQIMESYVWRDWMDGFLVLLDDNISL